MKFALLSHVLPPAPSGQAVMLFRILSGFAPEEYYLISRERYEQGDDANYFLSAKYYHLQPFKYLFLLNKFGFGVIRDIPTIILSILSRAWGIMKLMRHHPVDVLVACSGDIADIPAGFIASSILRIPFIIYLFDDYVYQWTGIYRLFARLVAPFIFRRCAGVIGPNEFICDEYRQQHEVKCALIRNPGDQEELEKPVYSGWPSEAGKITITYTGAIYHANYDCFQNLVHVLDMLQEPCIELHIFTSQTEEQLTKQGIHGEKIYVHSHVPYAEILEHQRKADILFLPLAFETPIREVIRTSAPGKLAEYLASGRPVLAHAPADSFVAYYLEKNQCGLIASKNDSTNLKEDILRLIGDDSFRRAITHNARQRAQLDFDPKVARKRFTDFLSTAIYRNTR
jgi:glycosyltransferase involved in cell wall biosynthesis